MGDEAEPDDLDALLVVTLPDPDSNDGPAVPDGDRFPGEPVRRRRTSARGVVTIALAALVPGTLLNADGLLRTAQRQRLGWQRTASLTIMEPVERFAHRIGIDRPAVWLADAVGHHDDTGIRSTEGVHLARDTTVPATAPSKERPVGTTTTTTTLPARRIPTAEEPLRVLVAGDSLSDGIATSLSAALAGRPVTVDLDRRVGTGLARPDVIDWHGEVAARMDADRPDVVVLIFGGNDAQALRTVDGWVHTTDTDAWRDEYERRVAQMMNIVARPGVSVYWIGMPTTNVASIQDKVPVINEAIRIEAAARAPQVTFVDPAPALDGPGGSYTATLPDADGRAVTVRHDDGVHMTVAGTDRVIALFAPGLIDDRLSD